MIAGHRLFDRQHEARLRGVLADVARDHLVHADAAVDDRALLQRHAGQQVAGHPGMDADAGRGLVEQAVDDVDLRLDRLERLQRLAQLHRGAAALGRPGIRIDAVALEDDGEALRRRGDCLRPRRRRHRLGRSEARQRLHPRQRHRHTDALQERSTRNSHALLLSR